MKIKGYKGNFYWSDVGTLEAYRAAQRDVLTGKVNVRIPGAWQGERLWADHSARVHPTVSLEGGVLIGQDAVVGRGVTVTGETTVGGGCWIQPAATVKRSILLSGACVGKGAYLENCIVGPGYYVRSGECIRDGALVQRAL